MNPEVYLINKLEEVNKIIFSELMEQYGDPPIEKVMPLLLFRKIVEKCDAIKILHDNNSGQPALSFARSVLENRWYFMFIIDNDSEFRSLSYYYFDRKDNAKKEIKEMEYYNTILLENISNNESYIIKYQAKISFVESLKEKCVSRNSFFQNQKIAKMSHAKLEEINRTYEEMIKGHEEEILQNKLKIEKIEKRIESFRIQIEEMKKTKERLVKILRRLNQDELFLEVRQEEKNISGYRPSWYSLKTGVRNIFQLSKSLGLQDEYVTYARLSQEVHSANASQQLVIDNDITTLTKFRDEKGSESAMSMASMFLSYSIEPFLEFYGKEDIFKEISEQMAQFFK
ncbi:hypothetical protein UP17_16350 [Peribacillus simplex]|uniref:DUF5677 domain-containing protein n=1 Tax=Peribacillus simplex TaxID=1478 RepID=UPI0007775A0E|nr:DUF5677 domain-containing protein [Peribacillus simplex]AMM93852.1 hypothetical protein UP17_16350 [Peribacillus simplex]